MFVWSGIDCSWMLRFCDFRFRMSDSLFRLKGGARWGFLISSPSRHIKYTSRASIWYVARPERTSFSHQKTPTKSVNSAVVLRLICCSDWFSVSDDLLCKWPDMSWFLWFSVFYVFTRVEEDSNTFPTTHRTFRSDVVYYLKVARHLAPVFWKILVFWLALCSEWPSV